MKTTDAVMAGIQVRIVPVGYDTASLNWRDVVIKLGQQPCGVRLTQRCWYAFREEGWLKHYKVLQVFIEGNFVRVWLAPKGPVETMQEVAFLPHKWARQQERMAA